MSTLTEIFAVPLTLWGLIIGMFKLLANSKSINDAAGNWVTKKIDVRDFDQQFLAIRSSIFGDTFFHWKRFRFVFVWYLIACLFYVAFYLLLKYSFLKSDLLLSSMLAISLATGSNEILPFFIVMFLIIPTTIGFSISDYFAYSRQLPLRSKLIRYVVGLVLCLLIFIFITIIFIPAIYAGYVSLSGYVPLNEIPAHIQHILIYAIETYVSIILNLKILTTGNVSEQINAAIGVGATIVLIFYFILINIGFIINSIYMLGIFLLRTYLFSENFLLNIYKFDQDKALKDPVAYAGYLLGVSVFIVSSIIKATWILLSHVLP